jgi:hypothetical protein
MGFHFLALGFFDDYCVSEFWYERERWPNYVPKDSIELNDSCGSDEQVDTQQIVVHRYDLCWVPGPDDTSCGQSLL